MIILSEKWLMGWRPKCNKRVNTFADSPKTELLGVLRCLHFEVRDISVYSENHLLELLYRVDDEHEEHVVSRYHSDGGCLFLKIEYGILNQPLEVYHIFLIVFVRYQDGVSSID